MSIPARKLSPQFDLRIKEALNRYAPETTPLRLAEQVKKLSDFYLIAPGSPTPWDTDYAVIATLSYFMPLNGVRLGAVFKEVERFLPEQMISEIWDFGSGLGTTQWVLEDQAWLPSRSLFRVETSSRALDVHSQLENGSWHSENRSLAHQPSREGAMAIFSYSFLEMQKSLPSLGKFDHILILEPSTRECGRALMEWRSKFLHEGFHILAPCTHDEACPLLSQSSRDWCHMRVPFEQPDWFQQIESHLPMKNRSLTYSYLLISRSQKRAVSAAGRVIGDTLTEKGKTRQMICRGPQREFLSWLHKNGSPPQIPHGALIRSLEEVELKGQEVRTNTLVWD